VHGAFADGTAWQRRIPCSGACPDRALPRAAGLQAAPAGGAARQRPGCGGAGGGGYGGGAGGGRSREKWLCISYTSYWLSPGRTRMRSPPVKRQTIPLSGFFLFFPLTGLGAVYRQSRVLTRFPDAGANPVWLHHTRIAALSPPWWRLQRTVGVLLCGLEMRLCPRPGLFTGVAMPGRRAR